VNGNYTTLEVPGSTFGADNGTPVTCRLLSVYTDSLVAVTPTVSMAGIAVRTKREIELTKTLLAFLTTVEIPHLASSRELTAGTPTSPSPCCLPTGFVAWNRLATCVAESARWGEDTLGWPEGALPVVGGSHAAIQRRSPDEMMIVTRGRIG
jgi:hypothetical protein